MTCALACAIKDHAVQLALAVQDDPPSLVNISLRQATTGDNIRTWTLRKASVPEYRVYERGLSD